MSSSTLSAVTSGTPQASQTQLSLARIADAWRRSGGRGGAFVQALSDFLRQYRSEHTSRSYRHAITEFWLWIEKATGSMPTPDRVERRHVTAFVEWLRGRVYGLDELKLERDEERRLERLICETLRQKPGLDIDAIRTELIARGERSVLRSDGARILAFEETDPLGLDRYLACLVERTKSLLREPTVEELRRRDPTLYARLDERIDPSVFRYYRNPHTRAVGMDRASTMRQRLTALSSFWRYLIQATAENSGRQPLLQHNIWLDAVKALSAPAASRQQVSREKKTPDEALVLRLLETCREDLDAPLEDVRDRAIILFMYWTGLRVSATCRLRRGDYQDGQVTVTDKGNIKRMIAMPPPAAEALGRLEAKIAALAADAERRRPGAMPRMARLLEASAPLFPAVARWGCNATSARAETEAGLTRQAVAMMLRRRAVAAGVAPGSADFARVHPHGFRHRGALDALDRGVALPVVQAVLGHKHLSTTGVYVEARDPRTVSLHREGSQAAPGPTGRGSGQAPAPPTEAAPAAPPRPAERPRRTVIDTVGVEAPPPPEERLVAVGRQAPLSEPLPSAREIATAERLVTKPESKPVLLERAGARVAEVYEAQRWGETGQRTQLHTKKTVITGVDMDPEDDLLTQVYVGKATGLPWWAGPSGQLRPEMPVAAPEQLAGPGLYGDLPRALDDLWLAWMTDPEKGPTAARALVEWVKQAAAVTEQVGTDAKQRKITWVRFDAPLSMTERGKAMRMHREDMIVRWFSVRAGTYMATLGREGEAVGEGRARPSRVFDGQLALDFYRDVDPVAALPEADREELFDWLYALVGKVPAGTTKRYPRAPGGAPALSRRDLAGLLGALCDYDAAADALKDAVRRRRDGRASDAEVKREKASADEAAIMVDAKVAELRRSKEPFNVRGKVEARIDEREEGRQSRRDHYMQLIGELFGPEAAADEALRVFALCWRSPLAGSIGGAPGDYADLFVYDKKRGTIVHDPSFATRFAKATGAHSECVARRIARQLWEMRKTRTGRRSLSRGDELVQTVDTLAYYLVPCPAELEGELRQRLGAARPPVAAWLASVTEPTRELSAKERRLLAAELEEQAARGALARSSGAASIAGDEGLGGYQIEQRYLSNAAQYLPSPVRLYAWVCT